MYVNIAASSVQSTLLLVRLGILGRLLLQPLFVVYTKPFLPGAAVVGAVHQHGASGQMRRDSVAVLPTPGLEHRVLRLGGDAQVFQMHHLAGAHANDDATDETHDGNDWVGRGIAEEGLLDAVLVDVLRIQ